METRSKRRKTAESIVDKIQCGEISIFVALAEELPDVFASEILPKLDVWTTLNLAQVSKSYNDAVWSVEGVRCMDAKMKAYAEKSGKTFVPSMHCAAGYGNLPAVRAHLESGEDVNTSDPKLGQTALHLAAYFDRPVTLKALIEAGADVNAQNSDGGTPLYSAAHEDNPMIVMELIKAGADVNLARPNGATPLHMAAQRGHEGCVVALIRDGADVHRRTEMGNTPIDYKHEKIAKMLRHLGARDD